MPFVNLFRLIRDEVSSMQHLASFRGISFENGLVLRISASIIVTTSWIGNHAWLMHRTIKFQVTVRSLTVLFNKMPLLAEKGGRIVSNWLSVPLAFHLADRSSMYSLIFFLHPGLKHILVNKPFHKEQAHDVLFCQLWQ